MFTSSQDDSCKRCSRICNDSGVPGKKIPIEHMQVILKRKAVRHPRLPSKTVKQCKTDSCEVQKGQVFPAGKRTSANTTLRRSDSSLLQVKTPQIQSVYTVLEVHLTSSGRLNTCPSGPVMPCSRILRCS